MSKPITWTEYKKRTEIYWKGKFVKTLFKMGNGYWAIPEGTILRITRKYQGFDLKAVQECTHCGIGKRLSISRVAPTKVELCEEEQPPTPPQVKED